MATEKEDYYRTLEVERAASPEEIKKAYRKLALKFHPDRNPGNRDAEERFKQISEAYEILGEPEKRSRYDQFGHAAFSRGAGGGGGGFGGFGGIDLEEALRTFMGTFGGGGSIFDNFFGGESRREDRTPRGADLRLDLEIDFEESVLGAEREIPVTLQETCAACDGKGSEAGHAPERCRHCEGRGVRVTVQGFMQFRQPCPVCGGSGQMITHPCKTCRGQGRVKARQSLSVRIPPGVETGSRLRLAGKGEGGVRGGVAGDLYVVLHVRPHDLFERHDEDILCEMPIPFHLATVGGPIQIPTIHGWTELTIPAGTQSGQVFRIRGKGVAELQSGLHGDHHVRVTVEPPARLNRKQRKLLDDLVETLDETHFPKRREFQDKARRFYERRDTLRR
ncbi:MAG: molecular chaperone DnaJ [Kiritimatiellia bacterium]|nr:molecular chaperone DnaJ [Kiritimatiellia bacterium]